MIASLFGLASNDLLVVIAIGAFVTSAIHGATGVAGGFLMSAIFAPIIGVHAVVPVMTAMMLVSHSSRSLLNIRKVNWRAFTIVALSSVPFIAVAAFFYNDYSAAFIGFLMGTIILSSIPLRRLETRLGQTSDTTLGVVGSAYGALSGASIGPGMLLTPFLLGYGLRKEAFVATLASIAFTTNVARFSLFSATDLYTLPAIYLGVFAGLITIPGNWLGRAVLRKISTESHLIAVEVIAALGALQFFYLAIKDLNAA